ncbi:hypothetical protein Tco_0174336 [Tanacetum coccineum]
MLAICSAAKPMVFKAPKPFSNAEKPRGNKRWVSKAPTGSKTGHLKRKKYSSSTMESNPSQTLALTPVVTEMHKEDQQTTGGPNSLGVTSEEKANPQLSSENSTPESDPGKSASSYFIPQQQGVNEGTKNTSYVHLFAEASRIIKLENLAKLVQNVQPSFKELDSREDDPIIVVDDSDEDEDADKDGLHATLNIETEDASHKLELEKNKVEAEVALLKAQPSFSNMGQLNELLVKSLQTEFLKILSAHNFSSSLITELKDLPSKFNELTEEVKGFKKQVHELEIELPGDLKEIPTKLKDFTKTVTIETIQAKLKTLDALPSLLNKVTNALNQFAQAITSKKIEDASVPLAG